MEQLEISFQQLSATLWTNPLETMFTHVINEILI